MTITLTRDKGKEPMNRRGFLGAMLGLAAAPAIVKAENLMKLWVPSQEIITDPYADLGDNYTVETWMRPDDSMAASLAGVAMNQWYHVSISSSHGVQTKRINGVAVDGHPLFESFDHVIAPVIKDKTIILDTPKYDGMISDLRLSKGIARKDGGFEAKKKSELSETIGLYLGGRR